MSDSHSPSLIPVKDLTASIAPKTLREGKIFTRSFTGRFRNFRLPTTCESFGSYINGALLPDR